MPIGILILLIVIGAFLLLFHKSYAEASTYHLWVMRSRLEKPMRGFGEFIVISVGAGFFLIGVSNLYPYFEKYIGKVCAVIVYIILFIVCMYIIQLKKKKRSVEKLRGKA
jgi:multisubunit Na+/H+ antiporter MnhB subunit